MSCALIVVPVVSGAWPVLAAAAGAAAVGLGYRVGAQEVSLAETHVVEFVAGTCREDAGSPIDLVRDGISLRVWNDRGEFRVRVRGAKSCAELEKIGREFLERTRQAFAYETTRREYEARGFVLVNEEKDSRGRLRLRFRRLR